MDDRKLWETAFHVHAKNLKNSVKQIYKFISGKSLRLKENQDEFKNLWWNKYFATKLTA